MELELDKILSVKETNNPNQLLVQIDILSDEELATYDFVLSSTDMYGLSPAVREAVQEWVAAGNTIQPYVPPVETVTYPDLLRWEFIAMVEYMGVADDIELAISQIPDALQRSIVKSRYANSNTYRRSDPLFASIGSQIGLSDEDINAAWLQIVSARSQ